MPFTDWATGDVITATKLDNDNTVSVGTDTARTITVTHTFSASQTFSAGLTAAASITSTLGTITSSTPAHTSTATWNSGAVTFTHLFANITDTTSAAASLLMDLQVGGASQFSVRKDGVLRVVTGGTVSVYKAAGRVDARFGSNVYTNYSDGTNTIIDSAIGAWRMILDARTTDTSSTWSVGYTAAGVNSFTNLLEMSNTGLLTLTSGQLKFPGTQSASTNVNTLDDYEEGTWTPSLGGDATYTSQLGQYVKIGKLVYVLGDITVNVLGTGSTTVISGLPFTCDNTVNTSRPGFVGFFDSLATNVIALYVRVVPNTTTATFAMMAASGASVTNAPAIFGNGARVMFSAVYDANA